MLLSRSQRLRLAWHDFTHDPVLAVAGLLALVAIGLFVYRLFTL